MQEKRLVDRLQVYWTRIKEPDQIVPKYQRFNADAVHDLWPKCIVLEVVTHHNSPTALYTYDYMGKDIVNAYGNDLTGQYVNVHMHNFPGWQILKSVDSLLHEPKVIITEGSFVNDAHRVIRYRACLLPFGKEQRLTHVVVGLSWKEFS